jgi:hypothetical protein
MSSREVFIPTNRTITDNVSSDTLPTESGRPVIVTASAAGFAGEARFHRSGVFSSAILRQNPITFFVASCVPKLTAVKRVTNTQ